MVAARRCRHGGSGVVLVKSLLCVLLCGLHSCVAKEDVHADALAVENLRVPVIVAFKVSPVEYQCEILGWHGGWDLGKVCG